MVLQLDVTDGAQLEGAHEFIQKATGNDGNLALTVSFCSITDSQL